ncbi:MAG: D-alanyl-D-alanine carboxypeptidase [Schwartzia sp.]|nr:D-alanyl-D-alanine carboxypeptidase [Schwartzia sp. (in: firmicutes)]
MHRVVLHRFFRVAALVVLAAVFAAGTAFAALPAPPWISAEAAILVEASTGRVIYEKNADRLMYPASMTKMVTCLLALEQWKDLAAPVTVGPEAAATEGTDFLQGDVLTMRELLMALMMESDNGAAVAVAEAMTPSHDVMDFAANMTQKAWMIGAKQTRFANPNGLPDIRHVTTARDMMKIARYGWANKEFRRIVDAREHMLVWNNSEGRQQRKMENTNELLYSYPGMSGIKTGWTRAAGGCLAGAATRDGVTLICIVMNAPNVDDRFKDTARLLDYGFPLVRLAKGPVKEKIERSVWVHDGSTYKVTAHPREDVKYLLFEGDDKKKFKIDFDMPRFIRSSIKGGDKVGDLVVLYDGKEVGRIDMIADKTIQKGFSPVAAVLSIYDRMTNPSNG